MRNRVWSDPAIGSVTERTVLSQSGSGERDFEILSGISKLRFNYFRGRIGNVCLTVGHYFFKIIVKNFKLKKTLFIFLKKL